MQGMAFCVDWVGRNDMPIYTFSVSYNGVRKAGDGKRVPLLRNWQSVRRDMLGAYHRSNNGVCVQIMERMREDVVYTQESPPIDSGEQRTKNQEQCSVKKEHRASGNVIA